MPDHDKNKVSDTITEEYLMTLTNEMEFAVVEGILRYEGIPFIKRYLHAGDYARVYMGFTNLGIEIFVSNEDLQRAKDAIHKAKDDTEILG